MQVDATRWPMHRHPKASIGELLSWSRPSSKTRKTSQITAYCNRSDQMRWPASQQVFAKRRARCLRESICQRADTDATTREMARSGNGDVMERLRGRRRSWLQALLDRLATEHRCAAPDAASPWEVVS